MSDPNNLRPEERRALAAAESGGVIFESIGKAEQIAGQSPPAINPNNVPGITVRGRETFSMVQPADPDADNIRALTRQKEILEGKYHEFWEKDATGTARVRDGKDYGEAQKILLQVNNHDAEVAYQNAVAANRKKREAELAQEGIGAQQVSKEVADNVNGTVIEVRHDEHGNISSVQFLTR